MDISAVGRLGKKVNLENWLGLTGKFKEITAHRMCQSTVQREANGLEGGTFGGRISVAILVQCTDCSLCSPSQRPCMMALCCVDIVCVTVKGREVV